MSESAWKGYPPIEERDAEIERLRGALDALQTHFDIKAKLCDEKDAEIERLRGLLREALEDGYIRVPYGASHEDVSAILDFEKRIKEAI